VRLLLLAGALVAAATVAVLALRHGGNGQAEALPSCARPAATIARPRDLPARFPLPAGTAFTSRYRNRLTHGVPQVEGRMPLGLDDAARYLNDELPRAGFRLRYRQRTADGFAAFYETKGYGGHFTVTPLPSCRGASAFAVSARPTLLGRTNSQ
jgi:hypothetical protein